MDFFREHISVSVSFLLDIFLLLSLNVNIMPVQDQFVISTAPTFLTLISLIFWIRKLKTELAYLAI